MCIQLYTRTVYTYSPARTFPIRPGDPTPALGQMRKIKIATKEVFIFLGKQIFDSKAKDVFYDTTGL